MAVYFGTDGIRDKAEVFTPEFIQKIVIGLGRYAGTGVEAESGAERPMRVLLGGDTRESTEWILRDFEEAFETIGVDHGNVGVLPTPGINYAFYEMGYDLAVDVTASHNPFSDNGVKIFERGEKNGKKLGELGVDFVEEALKKGQALNVQTTELAEDLHEDALELYLTHLKKYATMIGPADEKLRKDLDFGGVKIGLDCANGATGVVAKRVFEELGAEVAVINCDDHYGRKINQGCGSTDLTMLRKLVSERGLDFGAAFDGDGDRCMMIDAEGNEVDGDQMLAILAEYLGLKKVATTVMANQGLLNWGIEKGVEIEITDVGDQNVAAAMRDKGILLGAEQSGHVILPGESVGDGVLTALVMTKVITGGKKDLTELSKVMKKMPQVLVNVKVSGEIKKRFRDGGMDSVLADYENTINERGWRMLVRASGTENLIRVTLWGDDKNKIESMTQEIAEKIKQA